MKVLFVCNTAYQVLVASWIKYCNYNGCDCDIIISDHMNGYKTLKHNAEKVGLFKNVYNVESKNYVYNKDGFFLFVFKRVLYRFFPKTVFKKTINNEKYDILYISNFDIYNILIFNVLKKRNENLELNVFEDGISTYGLKSKDFYEYFKPSKSFIVRIIRDYGFIRKTFYNNVSAMKVFEPELCEWNPNCRIDKLDRLNPEDTVFKKIVNTIFDYYSIEDKYEEKFIFFEESFFADSEWNEDVKLVEKIADIVGKENLLIKTHPRNPVNRFKDLGYKTNTNTSVPWEVIALNINVADKVLLTISSTSAIAPAKFFNIRENSFSLMNCIENTPELLNGNFLPTVKKFFDYYNVYITNNINEISNI